MSLGKAKLCLELDVRFCPLPPKSRQTALPPLLPISGDGVFRPKTVAPELTCSYPKQPLSGRAPIIPCHRVLAAGGKLGGFSAPGGANTKLRMLALEGVNLNPPPLAQGRWGF